MRNLVQHEQETSFNTKFGALDETGRVARETCSYFFLGIPFIFTGRKSTGMIKIESWASYITVAHASLIVT